MKTLPPKLKLNYKLNSTGARDLICAVIEQAVTDFKDLVAAGRIADGKLMPGDGRRIRDYRTDADVQALLDFFNSRVMDEWIFLGRIQINPNFIREKLGLQRQPYDIYHPDTVLGRNLAQRRPRRFGSQ